MNELDNLLKDIENLRSQLHKLIAGNSGNLHDPEVISASEMLNAAILKYNEIISKKINK